MVKNWMEWSGMVRSGQKMGSGVVRTRIGQDGQEWSGVVRSGQE